MSNCTFCNTVSTSNQSTTVDYGTITDFEEKFVTVITIIIALAAIIGNGLVFCAFAKFRKLRNSTNFFIINLASMDFLIGTIPATFWAAYLICKWPSRQDVFAYKFWECMEVVCGFGSIWSLTFIAIDRYICIKDALRYYSLVTKTRVLFCIAFIWVFSVLAGVLSFLKYEFKKPDNWFRYYVFNAGYTIPLVIMAFCYIHIFLETLRHSRELRQTQSLGAFVDANENKTACDVQMNGSTPGKDNENAQTKPKDCKTAFDNPSYEAELNDGFANENQLNGCGSLKNNSHNGSPKAQVWKIELESSPGEDKRYKTTRKFYPNSRLDLPRESIAIGWGQTDRKSNSAVSNLALSDQKPTEHTKKLQRKKADLKAARTLSFIMGVLLLTWTPFIMTLMIYAWNPSIVTLRWMYAVKCMHYCNSGLNPFLYTVLNRAFRQAFATLLCGRKK